MNLKSLAAYGLGTALAVTGCDDISKPAETSNVDAAGTAAAVESTQRHTANLTSSFQKKIDTCADANTVMLEAMKKNTLDMNNLGTAQCRDIRSTIRFHLAFIESCSDIVFHTLEQSDTQTMNERPALKNLYIALLNAVKTTYTACNAISVHPQVLLCYTPGELQSFSSFATSFDNALKANTEMIEKSGLRQNDQLPVLKPSPSETPNETVPKTVPTLRQNDQLPVPKPSPSEIPDKTVPKTAPTRIKGIYL